MEVFTSIVPTRQTITALPFEKYKSCGSLSFIKASQLLDIDSLQTSMECVHRDVNDRVCKARMKARHYHDQKTNVLPINFHIGDYVLVRSPRAKQSHKLEFKWIGPRRITQAKSSHVFICENLNNHSTEAVHARRLLLYRSDMENQPVTPSLLSYAEFLESSIQVITTLHSIQKHGNSFSVLVEWDGLPDKCDYTWEPAKQIKEDAPGILEDFLYTTGQRGLKRQALSILFSED